MINCQFNLDDTFGSCGARGSIASDGAGAISIYNILELMGKRTELDDVIRILRKHHILSFTGKLRRWRVRRALKCFGIDSKYMGRFKAYSQIGEKNRFIIFYRSGVFPFYFVHCQAGRLVKDKNNQIWIELFNPFHRYNSITQFKKFEDIKVVYLYSIK